MAGQAGGWAQAWQVVAWVGRLGDGPVLVIAFLVTIAIVLIVAFTDKGP